MTKNPLKNIVYLQKQGKAVGIYSCCSANHFVLNAAIKKAKEDHSFLLIESTANQVNQYGGYTGMTPQAFKELVYKKARQFGLSTDRILLGGDHLGPLTWTDLPEKEAMEKAAELIEEYILAGFIKIHIDTSMKLKDDDPNTPLSNEIIAKRGAFLAKVANDAYNKLLTTNPNAMEIVYIIGSEVPIPGGAQGNNSTDLEVTKVEDFRTTYTEFKKAFANEGISDIFDHVIAIVVQPGMEEQDSGCVEYDRSKAKELMNEIKKFDGLVFEGHSSDYQTKTKLRELVEDGIGILKVGPGLTFAAREALFSLANIEKELFCGTNIQTSNFIATLEEEMMKSPKNWNKYYTGDENQKYLKRKYSFSDRSRYYMANEKVEASINTLLDNLKTGIPLNLISQFMPIQYTKIREGKLSTDPVSLIEDRIMNTLDEYLYATHQKELG